MILFARGLFNLNGQRLVVCRGSRISVLSIARLTVLGLSGVRNMAGIVHGRTSHTSLLTWAISSGRGNHLSIASGVSLAVALPEWATTSALGVVVGRVGSIALLLLVMAGEEELDDSSDEKEEDVADGDGEAGGVQAANIAPITGTRCRLIVKTSTKWGIDDAST